MFDISLPELSLITLIALLVLGPERLPHVAHTLGRTIKKLRHLYHRLSEEINTEHSHKK